MFGTIQTKLRNFTDIFSAGSFIGRRPNVNFKLGTGMSNTVADNVTTDSVDVTLGLSVPVSVANGGTNATSASITAFNNITGYTAAGATGTTSTNLVFSTSPTLVTPTLGAALATSINFGGDTLSSYAVGTWVPAITFATPGDLNVAYTQQTGWYVKIGRLVIVSFKILTSTFTHTTSSGALSITGLPFAASMPNNTNATGALDVQGITKTNYTSFVGIIPTGGSTLAVNTGGSGQAQTGIASADMPSGGTVLLNSTICYTAAT